MQPILTIIFSRDRAMQLRATLDSFIYHCPHLGHLDMVVYYRATNERMQRQYDFLRQFYSDVQFVCESNFEKDVRGILSPYRFVLMQVDDNIWVRECNIIKAKRLLRKNDDIIGYSYRLSPALKLHYLTGRKISMPKHKDIDGVLKYQWDGKGHEFGYAIEVTGSLYRVPDIKKCIQGRQFSNPNSFEKVLSKARSQFVKRRPYLVCQKNLSVFMAPINLVQTCTKNKSGRDGRYSVESLAQWFDDGYKIDVTKFRNFEVQACGNEVNLEFIKDER